MKQTINIEHEKIHKEILDYMIQNNDVDPIELLKSFAERIRVLLNCDQVIYRDLEETRIMVNSPAIEKTWSVPIDYCKQCQHFDAHHPMYAGGYTEMDNCQEGWQGIPVYEKCPIKSSLTRIVYCDGAVAGYLAIHYVQNYHHFTNEERNTLEEFTRILSLALSRYEAKKKSQELISIKKTFSMTFALSDQYDPIMIVDPETGEYDWLLSVAQDVADNTSMNTHGENLYKNIEVDASSVVHEDDRDQLRAFFAKDNFIKIAKTGEPQETENRWFIQTEGRYKWKYCKAVRMIDETGKVYVVLGVRDTTEEKEKELIIKKEHVDSENYARFFALEDDFESLYDVDANSGNYEVFVKGDFYKDNVLEKLTTTRNYFKDLEENIKSVIYKEDREGLFNASKKEYIIEQLSKNDHFDYYYRLNTADGPVWFKMRCVYKNEDKTHFIIGVFNAAQEMAVKEKEEEHLRITELQLRHEKLRGDVLNYMINNEDDPIELLKIFADQARVLFGCDQVLYRDLKETRIMANSDGIANDWSVPIEYCRQCPHFDAFHPLYKDGYTEMEDCKKGWRGVPVYEKCPIKSAFTRIVYCDGEVAGYLTIHYLNNYHKFTDIERETIEIFSRILSISLSRYKARQENKELRLIKEMQKKLQEAYDKERQQLNKTEESLVFTNFFLDTYVSAYYVDLKKLTCKVYKRTSELENDYPIITNYFDSITDYINNDVHPDDRKALLEVIKPEKMKELIDEKGEYTHVFRDISGGAEKVYRMQVIRGHKENHVAFGFTDITSEIKEQKNREKEAAESQKLIDSIAASYNVAYAVNMSTDEFRQLRMDSNVIGYGEKFNSFKEAKEFFINILPECDKDKMRNELDYDTIKKKLKKVKTYNIEYRVPINNAIVWHEMNVTIIDSDNVAIGFANRDLEITQRHLEDKRYSEYFALYEIDLDTGMMKIVKDSPYYGIDRVGKAVPFVPAMLRFAYGLDDEPRQFFEKFADLSYTKKLFAKEDKITYAYRSNNVKDKSWVDCTCYVTMRHKDGTPAMFTFGFSLVDSVGVYRQELQSKYKEALDVVNEEKNRNDIIHDIIHSGKWSFRVSADDKVIGADYSQEVMRVVNNDLGTGAHDWIEIIHPDDKEATLAAYNATIKDHSCKTPYDVAFRMADRNGVYHWFHSAGRIVRNADGTGEFFGIHIDITSQIDEQLKQQEMLNNARLAADAANKAKSNFLFNMSHDIRTPMNAIRGFTMMAKKNAGDEEKVIEYLNKIDISGQQLLTLINQVLEMARIESGKVEFEENPINVQEEFNSMVTVLTEQAMAKGLNFNYSIDVKHNHLFADEARMSSITLNITGNAMKYTPEGGTIDFRLKEIESRKPGYATFVFTVSDTGIGMSKEYLKTIYDPFSREKSSTVSKIQGTGLGMSIVKNTIDLLGGNIEVQSEPGKGTKFDVTVDFKINEVETTKEEEEELIPLVSLKGYRVLLVEDNELNREIAKDVLEEQGLIVEDANDGDVAVSMIQAIVDRKEYDYYDFVLMDIQMPKMNGYEATKAIRAIEKGKNMHTPIIAMTANAFEEDRQNALKAGMDDHLAKPIDIQKMLKTISRFVK